MHALTAPATSTRQDRDTRLVRSTLFFVVIGLWIAFGGAAIVHPETLSQLWSEIGQLPLSARVPAGLLFFPWVAALAVWDGGLESWLRDSIVIGLAWMSIHLVVPRTTRTG